jgi:hypothetical protein
MAPLERVDQLAAVDALGGRNTSLPLTGKASRSTVIVPALSPVNATLASEDDLAQFFST